MGTELSPAPRGKGAKCHTGTAPTHRESSPGTASKAALAEFMGSRFLRYTAVFQVVGFKNDVVFFFPFFNLDLYQKLSELKECYS